MSWRPSLSFIWVVLLQVFSTWQPWIPAKAWQPSHQRHHTATPTRLNNDNGVDFDNKHSMSRRSALLKSAVFLASSKLAIRPSPAWAAYIDPATDPLKITNKVYLDVVWTADGGRKEESGRITLGLFGDVMPKTGQNFVSLCESNAYAGTTFYRIVSDFSIQGGAVGDATGKTGKSSLSDGRGFEPDNFNVKHTQAGLISMVRALDGTVDSRFFLQCNDNGGWADDRYAAFGIVSDDTGIQIMKQLEKLPVQPPKNNPKNDVKIVASGVLPL